MRTWISALLLISPALAADEKIGFDDRVEIVRGLTSEYATMKAPLPRSKKPLPFDKEKPFQNLGMQRVAAATGHKLSVDDIELTLREFGGTDGVQQISKGAFL